jgi:hypothetical protein
LRSHAAAPVKAAIPSTSARNRVIDDIRMTVRPRSAGQSLISGA